MDFESKKVPVNIDAIIKFTTKVLHAYPLRLKRVLFLNVGNGANSPIIGQTSELIKKFDQDVQVETIGNLDDLTRVIGPE